MYLFPDVPKVMPSGITIATLGDTVILQCTVDSYPAPKMMFWRDPKGREAVIEGGKYSTNIVEWKTVRCFNDFYYYFYYCYFSLKYEFI